MRLPKIFRSKKEPRKSAIVRQNIISLALELPVQEWLDPQEIRKIDEDSTVISAVSIRKSATLKKELIIEADERIAKEFERILGYTFRDLVLDTPLQGFAVFELNWYEKDGLLFPAPIERDYQSFALKDTKLYYGFDEVHPLKAIYTLYRPKFDAPMGRPLYHTLFWLRRFKSAGVEFWAQFVERFGNPWVVGKTDAEPDELARELYAMLGGDVAVVDPEDEIELKTPPNSKGAFKELIEYCDLQIREAITGGNLTGEVKGGSYAAAQTHDKIREDIAMTDEHILREAIKRIIDAFKELNGYQKDIRFALKDRDDPNYDLAERDYKLAQTFNGRYAFSKEYLERTYHIELIELQTPVAAKFSMSTTKKPQDTVEIFASSLDTTKIEDALLVWVRRIVAEAQTYEEAMERIAEEFETLDEKSIYELLQRAIGLGMLYGNGEAMSEES